MREPAGLYDFLVEETEIPHGLHMVAGLTGFTDAGSAVSQMNDYLVGRLESREVVRFSADELLDYRARRPTMFFDRDHLTDYVPARLSIHLIRDELGTPFLLLNGFEPDFQWERFSAAVLGIVEKFEVADTTWVHAIPMPTPHTRPLGVTVSGSRQDLIEAHSLWRPRTQVPTNVLHLIEHRLQQTGHPTVGFVILVPHYLSDTEFPATAVKALEMISAATGLIFPTDHLRAENRDFMSKVEDQVQGNDELQRLIETLERRHDSYIEENPLPSPLVDESGRLPTADSLAAELEKFLAAQRDDDAR